MQMGKVCVKVEEKGREKMKKAIVFCMAILLVFGLAACGTSEESNVVVPSSSSIPSIPTSKPDLSPVFTYSPYAITTFSKEAMGESYALYCDLVDALLNYDCEVSGFESETQFHGLWCILRQEFPPAEKLLADYGDTDEPYSFSDGRVTLKYLLDKTAHLQLLDNYAKRIQKDLSVLEGEDTEVIRIAKLHDLVGTTIVYGETTRVVYDAIMSNQGVCEDYAEYLIVLLNQIGVECYYACSDGEGVVGHAWVIAKMEGKFFHFDPTWHWHFERWNWFAMGDKKRKVSLLNAGVEDPSGDSVNIIGHINWLSLERIPLPECPSDYKPESRNNLEPWNW